MIQKRFYCIEVMENQKKKKIVHIPKVVIDKAGQNRSSQK